MNFKHKIFLLSLCSILFLSSASYAVPPKINPLPSDFNTGITWESAQKSDKPIAVAFYVDWCHYCRKFMPLFDNLRKEYQTQYNFVIIKSDDPINERLVKQYNIRSFPSVFLINRKKGKELFLEQNKYYDNQIMKDELNNFLK